MHNMSANYRIVIWHTDQGEVYSIHEVEYQNGVPASISAQPVVPEADSAQHLSNKLVKMTAAYGQPPLDSALVLPQDNAQTTTTVNNFFMKKGKTDV